MGMDDDWRYGRDGYFQLKGGSDVASLQKQPGNDKGIVMNDQYLADQHEYRQDETC